MIYFRSKIDKFNQVDNKIDRKSFTGYYYVDPITKRPRNPVGRTGSKKENVTEILYSSFLLVTGRGRLYHWGPNHAGDPVVTRYIYIELKYFSAFLFLLLNSQLETGWKWFDNLSSNEC
jgi:hypothetical protein